MESTKITTRESVLAIILSLRLEGKSSINGISTIMKRFEIDLSSTGSISQILTQIGSILPNTISTGSNTVQYSVFASDEIFSKSKPILITVDPISSAILRMELSDTRKAKDWNKHFECIQDNKIAAIYLVSDEGTGLCAAHTDTLNTVIRQPDTYHAVAHQLGHWVAHFESAAYNAIQFEFDSENKLNSAKSEVVIEKRLDTYDQSIKNTQLTINQYENFYYLYICIIQELQPFNKNGELRHRQEAEQNIESALLLIEAFKNDKITKVVNKIKRILPDILNYHEFADKAIHQCKQLGIDDEVLKILCLSWQWNKSAIKSKKVNRKKMAITREQSLLDLLEIYSVENGIKTKVYAILDTIIQSSALVECINSILRPYLNTSKNNISQETLNLIMYYHNHRRYHDGKRKNKTPFEILMGKEQKKDWIELILEKINIYKPTLLLNS